MGHASFPNVGPICSLSPAESTRINGNKQESINKHVFTHPDNSIDCRGKCMASPLHYLSFLHLP